MDSFNKVPPHGLTRGWLGTQFVERLLVYAESNEHLFKESTVTYGATNRIDISRRISRRLNNLEDFKQELKIKYRELLPAMFETLAIEPFDSTFELELVAHGHGAFFARHIDTITGRESLGSARIISTVYYFHTLPKAFSGGALRLHSLAATGQEGTFVDIPPDYDTLVFFPSMFPHEVLPVNSPSGKFLDSRFAINCWICRATIPSISVE